MMHSRAAVGIVIAMIVPLLIFGCRNQPKVGQSDLASTRMLVNALESNNLSVIQSQCGDGLQRKSTVWGPAVSKALNQQFGLAKDLSLMSSGVPADGWIEHIWSVQAERGNYQMRVSYLSGKIRHLEFRTMSNEPWTHVMRISQGQTVK